MALSVVKGGSKKGGFKPTDLNELLAKKQRARTARRVFERDWMLNLAFVKGEQYLTFDIQNNKLVEIDVPDGYEKVVENVMLKIARTERAKVLKVVPKAQCMPPGDSQKDEHIARQLNGYFRWLEDEWSFERRLRSAVWWTVVTGNVFIKWLWNKQLGRPDMSVVAPFDLYPDPYARSMLDCRWMYHTTFMDVDQAKEVYGAQAGKDGEKAIAVTSTETVSSIESRIFSNYGDGKQNLPGVVMQEFWRRPSGKDPGEYTVFTTHGIVSTMPYPYEHGMLPFTHIGHVEQSSSIWYDSVMNVIRPIQVEINRTCAQLIMNRNAAQGKWFIPAELELEDDPTADALQILRAVEGPPGIAPQYIQVNSLPSWVVEEMNRMKGAAQDIAGQHEVSNAGVPGRVEAAQAIQLLQESDDAPLVDTVHSMEESIAKGFFQAVALHKQFGDAKLLFDVNSEDGIIESFEIMKNDLPLSFKIDVKTTTGLPSTIAGRWDRVLNLWQQKVITDPNRVLELLDLAPESPDLVPDMLDRKVAFRENQKMAKGMVLRPNKHDNHGVHREEHEKYMKSEEWLQLDPDTQDMFKAHLDWHHQLELEVAGEQAQLQMTLAGGAPPGSGPPGSAPPPPAGGPPPPGGGAPPMPEGQMALPGMPPPPEEEPEPPPPPAPPQIIFEPGRITIDPVVNVDVDARQDPPVVHVNSAQQEPPVVHVNTPQQEPPVVHVDARQPPAVVHVQQPPPPTKKVITLPDGKTATVDTSAGKRSVITLPDGKTATVEAK